MFPALSVADAQIQYSVLSVNFVVSAVFTVKFQLELCAASVYSFQPVMLVTFPLVVSVVMAVLAVT